MELVGGHQGLQHEFLAHLFAGQSRTVHLRLGLELLLAELRLEQLLVFELLLQLEAGQALLAAVAPDLEHEHKARGDEEGEADHHEPHGEAVAGVEVRDGLLLVLPFETRFEAFALCLAVGLVELAGGGDHGVLVGQCLLYPSLVAQGFGQEFEARDAPVERRGLREEAFEPLPCLLRLVLCQVGTRMEELELDLLRRTAQGLPDKAVGLGHAARGEEVAHAEGFEERSVGGRSGEQAFGLLHVAACPRGVGPLHVEVL